MLSDQITITVTVQSYDFTETGKVTMDRETYELSRMRAIYLAGMVKEKVEWRGAAGRGPNVTASSTDEQQAACPPSS